MAKTLDYQLEYTVDKLRNQKPVHHLDPPKPNHTEQTTAGAAK